MAKWSDLRRSLKALHRFWSDRYADLRSAFHNLYLRQSLISGRNGGHLTETRQFFSEFSRVEKQQGVDEAVRAKALEHRNVQGIIAYLRENSLEEHVDFVPGGLLTLFVNPEEYRITREQYVSAKSAGVNVDGIEWLEEAETRSVSNECMSHAILLSNRRSFSDLARRYPP